METDMTARDVILAVTCLVVVLVVLRVFGII